MKRIYLHCRVAGIPSGEFNIIIGEFVTAFCLVALLNMNMQRTAGALYHACLEDIYFSYISFSPNITVICSLWKGLLASQVKLKSIGGD